MNAQDEDVIQAIRQSIPDAQVTLTALDCSKRGYYIEVTSQSFHDQSILQQHRRVKKALANFVDSEVLHAITIKTKS